MSSEQIFNTAAEIAQKLELPYAGAMPPADAHALHESGEAVIVDVRTTAEHTFVGKFPGAVMIELMFFPGMGINDRFMEQLREQVPAATPVLFLCRSGARSSQAAAAAAAAGYRAYNILEGFEGDLDDNGHRNKTNGWRARGLPWIQS